MYPLPVIRLHQLIPYFWESLRLSMKMVKPSKSIVCLQASAVMNTTYSLAIILLSSLPSLKFVQLWLKNLLYRKSFFQAQIFTRLSRCNLHMKQCQCVSSSKWNKMTDMVWVFLFGLNTFEKKVKNLSINKIFRIIC